MLCNFGPSISNSSPKHITGIRSKGSSAFHQLWLSQELRRYLNKKPHNSAPARERAEANHETSDSLSREKSELSDCSVWDQMKKQTSQIQI